MSSVGGRRAPNCPFCQIVAGEVPATIVFQNEVAVAFLAREGMATGPMMGKVLIVPRHHHVIPGDCREIWDPLFELATITGMKLMTAGLGEGYTVTMHVGQGGRQTVPHLCWHVQPEHGRFGDTWSDDVPHRIRQTFAN